MLNHLPEARAQSMMESRKRSKRTFDTHISKRAALIAEIPSATYISIWHNIVVL